MLPTSEPSNACPHKIRTNIRKSAPIGKAIMCFRSSMNL